MERAFLPLWSRLPAGPLVTLGKHSLIIYWVHIELVYGRWFWRSRGQLNLPTAALCFAAVLLSQVALAYAIDPAGAFLKRLFTRSEQPRLSLEG